MSTATTEKRVNRIRRHSRGRAKIAGTAERPRVAVFKSNSRTYAQAVDDVAHTTLASASDAAAKGTKTERALAAGKELAKQLKGLKVTAIVFDKGGFTYHGRVKAIADGLRDGGIKF